MVTGIDILCRINIRARGRSHIRNKSKVKIDVCGGSIKILRLPSRDVNLKRCQV